MKTIFTLAISLCMLTYAWATVRTVSNAPNVAQFTTIQLAIDASADGDTVYVYGSPNPYAGFTILDKKITIIGPGWAPDKNLPLQATVNTGVTIRNSVAVGSPDGSELHGLIFTSTVDLSRSQIGSDIPVNDIHIRRCQFNNNITWGYGAAGNLFEGCFFNSNTFTFTSFLTYENFLFQNNLFYMNNTFKFFNLVNAVNIRFDHNLFYSDNNGGGGVYPFFSNCRFFTLTNNIFNQVNVGQGLSFSTFNNNLTNNLLLSGTNAVSNATPWAVNDNVDGGGNVANQNPGMADQTLVNAGTPVPTANFTIASGPANNSGSDGKDMGLLFDTTGSLNWNNSRSARIPRIYSFNVTSPTVAPGANLSITVDARKSN
ncbi:MAG: hypothetical protein KF687_16765 [Cyclobacteriaceae bacterium]|nr:hypothetical protein [Cyclobacteriaceae bacterium]